MTLHRTPLVLMGDLSRSLLNLLSETDAQLRELERHVQANPGDAEASRRLANHQLRSGSLNIGGHPGEFSHVSHNRNDTTKTDYRAGYKAGWAHAHKHGDSPAQPDQSRGANYLRGFEHGSHISGHAQRTSQAYKAARAGPSRDTAIAANEAARKAVGPHLDTMAGMDNSGAAELRKHKYHSNQFPIGMRNGIEHWSMSPETPHRRLPVSHMARHVSMITSMVNQGKLHPADFASHLDAAAGVHMDRNILGSNAGPKPPTYAMLQSRTYHPDRPGPRGPSA